MKKETIFLSFIALLIGLLVAGGIFYSYRYFTTPQVEKEKELTLDPTPTPVSSNSDELMVNEPSDETVVANKSVTVSGKTVPGSTIVISSENDEQVATPAENGNFSVTTTIGEGVNLLEVIAILPSGEERKVIRTITFTTESF